MKPDLQRRTMEEKSRPAKSQPRELLTLQAQLRREIELADEKGIPTQPAKRKSAAVNREIAKIKRGETNGIYPIHSRNCFRSTHRVTDSLDFHRLNFSANTGASKNTVSQFV